MGRKILVDMVGLRYGRLVGLALSHRGPSGHAHWLFSCDCGAEVVAVGSRVRAGRTTSCGCRHREISAARLTVHGHRAGKRHGPTYRAWQAMKGCRAPPSPPGDGARGIAVCSAWSDDYERFLRDMGERPAGTALGCRDPAGGFAPGNCAWTPLASRSARACAGWEKRRAARATAEGLARAGASIVVDGRAVARVEDAVRQIGQALPGSDVTGLAAGRATSAGVTAPGVRR